MNPCMNNTSCIYYLDGLTPLHCWTTDGVTVGIRMETSDLSITAISCTREFNSSTCAS